VPQLSLPILEINWTPLYCGPRSRVPGEAGECGQELTACADTTTSLSEVLFSVTGDRYSCGLHHYILTEHKLENID